MAFVNEPSGRICSWGIPLAECWGVRLPRDCTDAVPAPLQLMEVPEGDYLVFEHGPFDLQTKNSLVEAKIERAMRDFDYEAAGCCLDTAPGRVFYFVHDCVRFWKYIRPVVRFCRLSRVNAQKSKNIFYEARMRAISSRKSCSEHR